MSTRTRPAGVLRRTRVRLPIRLKLATVSASLTFAILLLFALAVGGFTEQKLRSSFDDDLRATAADFQGQVRIRQDPETGSPVFTSDPELLKAAASGGAAVRVVNRFGGRLAGSRIELGVPLESVRTAGDYRVVSRPLSVGSLDSTGAFDLEFDPIDGTVAFVQYARPKGSLETTVDRVRFFLLLGVIGGTLLAFLAGLAVARRAMRPIAGLTKAAREVAETRDPAQTALPSPASNDEVSDLADTLAVMLRELAAARSETEGALDRQRAFVADASHELRTPLTAILANLELLEAELAGAGGLRDRSLAAETAGSALRSARRMRRLVGDLLVLARADASRPAGRQPVDLGAVVADASAEAGALASGHPVTLDLPAPGRGPVIEGSPDELHRLALNLIENALVHTPAGTPVTVSVARDGEHAVLAVADRGPGVPPELRERIFERFAREGGHGGSAGSGLGLAIVKVVADGHGGKVRIDDADGGGARFTVRLPAAPAIRSAPTGVESEHTPSPAPTEGAPKP